MAAGVADNYFKRISIPVLLLVVLSQLMGTFTEWLIIGNFNAVIQVFRRVIPGMSL